MREAFTHQGERTLRPGLQPDSPFPLQRTPDWYRWPRRFPPAPVPSWYAPTVNPYHHPNLSGESQ